MSNKSTKDIFQLRKKENPFAPINSAAHLYGQTNQVCSTESRGYATPKNKNPMELVLDASEGFIPLWSKGSVLKWRFSPDLMNFFETPDLAKAEIRRLFAEAIFLWGDSSPIKFKETDDVWDFEITVRPDNCSPRGCTLASAFFPDSGRHQLAIYPKMFTQPDNEQVETLVHELGHVFGLRHFFANITETKWASEIFGTHKPFTIMNYGQNSMLTDEDKSDLKRLYKLVWSGQLTSINGTKVILVDPFSTLATKKVFQII